MTARARLVSAVLAVALMQPAGSAARAQPSGDVAAARSLFVEGAQLAGKGRWVEARDRFERSLALKRASLTLYSLGVAQKQTGHLVEARESFLAFLAEPATPPTRPFRPPARDAVAEIEKRVARLTIRISPGGAMDLAVTMDGAAVPIGTLDEPRLVNPGVHTLVVKARDKRPTSVEVTLREGETVTALIALHDASNAATEATPTGPDRTVPFVVLGAGLATFMAGAATGLSGVAEASNAPTVDGALADNARSKALIGDVIGGLGLAVAVVGVGMLIMHARKPPPSPGAGAAKGSVGADANGVWIRF